MSTVLKIIVGNFDKCSRDKRELSVVRDMGHSVIVLNKGPKNEDIYIDKNYYIINCKVRDENSRGIKRAFQRIKSVVSWIIIARKCKPNVISGHDLSGLFIGWVSTLFLSKNKRPKLVYDAHEFEVGRILDNKKSKFKKRCIPIIEKFLISKSEFTIMVNNSIANAVKNAYSLKERPIVVRNIPLNWKLDSETLDFRRAELCKLLDIEPSTFIVMYHGSVMPGRGIETLLKVIEKGKDIAAVILGNGEEKYINKLKELSKDLGIKNKVLFKEAVPVENLWEYVGAVNVDVTLASNTCLNHYYMLPNKLFESLQSGTPVIGSDFPEISYILNTYNVGICVNPDSVDSILNAVYEMKNNNILYSTMKENIKNVKDILSWDKEKNILRDSYEKIL